MPYVETNGIDTYYESEGEGRSVVFIHPVRSTHRVWGPQVEALSDDYQIVRYDLRDHGKSGLASGQYTSEALASDLQELIEALDLEKPVICGLSIGGYVAQRHAVTYPGTASGYVFANTSIPETYTIEETFYQLLNRTISNVRSVVGVERMAQVSTKIYELVHDEEAMPDEETREELRKDVEMPSDEQAQRISHALNHWNKESLDLTTVSEPVLYLYGADDRDSFQTHIGRLAIDIEKFNAIEIPDAGHLVNQDNPTAFTNALRGFLEERFEQ